MRKKIKISIIHGNGFENKTCYNIITFLNNSKINFFQRISMLKIDHAYNILNETQNGSDIVVERQTSSKSQNKRE